MGLFAVGRSAITASSRGRPPSISAYAAPLCPALALLLGAIGVLLRTLRWPRRAR